MIGILGDIHGAAWVLEDAANRALARGCTALVQVGDVGFYPRFQPDFLSLKLPLPVYAIDGNHEDFPWLWSGGHSALKLGSGGKINYVHRGTVLELDGRRFGFLGGAGSIDKNMRLKYNMGWYAEEQISDADIERLVDSVGDHPLDFLIVHTPPQSVITKYFDTPHSRALEARKAFGAPPDWFDPSAHKVQAVWEQLGKPPIYCGHMHRAVTDGSMSGGFCRILDINELAYV